MTAGLLAVRVGVFGSAQAHHGHLFTSARASCVDRLVRDGFSVWGAARRLHRQRLLWPKQVTEAALAVVATARTSYFAAPAAANQC